MNRILKRILLPNLLATSLIGVSLVPGAPASADDKILRDVGIGAAAGAVTGIITNDNSPVTNAVNGAAAGAAVNAANGARSRRARARGRNCLQDVAVGAAGGTVAGAITNRRRTGSNAINGAAAGGAICLLTK